MMDGKNVQNVRFEPRNKRISSKNIKFVFYLGSNLTFKLLSSIFQDFLPGKISPLSKHLQIPGLESVKDPELQFCRTFPPKEP